MSLVELDKSPCKRDVALSEAIDSLSAVLAEASGCVGNSLWRGPQGPKDVLQPTVSKETASRKWILPTWMSLAADSSPLTPPDENSACPTPWLQPCETLSGRPSQAVSRLLSHRNHEMINVHCFKLLNLWSFVVQCFSSFGLLYQNTLDWVIYQ